MSEAYNKRELMLHIHLETRLRIKIIGGRATHNLMINGLIHQEDKPVLNMYASNKMISKYILKITGLQENYRFKQP